MSFGLLNLAVLVGLIAVIIPPVIHLLNRRRSQTVDWGAMQFLEISDSKRRRLLLEELLLMLLRMGLIALLVLALAAPFVAGPVVEDWGGQANRDIALIVDGSASMGLDDGRNPSPHQLAKSWTAQFADRLPVGDRLALIDGRQQPSVLIEKPSADAERIKTAARKLIQPAGGCAGPNTVLRALQILHKHGRSAQKDIIILTDGRRQGWADADSLAQWQKVAAWLRSPLSEDEVKPRIWFVNVSKNQADHSTLPNFSLLNSKSVKGQGWRGQSVFLKASLVTPKGKPFQQLFRLRFTVDGTTKEHPFLLKNHSFAAGSTPLALDWIFQRPGSHVLTLRLETKMAKGKRFKQFGLVDCLPGDNHCDVAVMIQETAPVLLVDGGPDLSRQGSTFFLRSNFSSPEDKAASPFVLARSILAAQFSARQLRQPLIRGKPSSTPKVLVLSDVPRLSAAQQLAVEEFLKSGGNVLVAIGPRVKSAAAYNDALYRNGNGWLPARLIKIAGDREGKPVPLWPIVEDLFHPLFVGMRAKSFGTLESTSLRRWWKVEAAKRPDVKVALPLRTNDPFLVEAKYEKGKVLLCSVPLDDSWGSNLIRLPEFPAFVHKTIYYLAGIRGREFNVQPGTPLILAANDLHGARPRLPVRIQVLRPDGKSESHVTEKWPFVYEDAHLPGVWRVTVDEKRPIYYVVQPDRQESNLNLLTADDRKNLNAFVPFRYEREMATIDAAAIESARQLNIWWLALLAVVLLLCAEIWLTRRMAARGA